MEYIVRLNDMPTGTQKEDIFRYVSKIYYESKLIPVLIIETNFPDKVEKLEFVKSIRRPEEGKFQEGEFFSTIIFTPPTNKKDLVNKQMLGWGDVRVAVLDSGVNENDISVVEYKDFTGTGTMDHKGHGTVVAKVVKHFAKGVNLYSGKVGVQKPDEKYVLPALEWAYYKGAKIINLSFGFKRNKPCDGTCEVCELVNKISEQGVAIVVAAGNNYNKINSIECPGVAVNSITVGAIDRDRNIASYSSFGKIGGNKPNLVSPGNLYLDGIPYQGTSFSAPLVSGVLGAILSNVGTISSAIEHIYETVDDLGFPRHQQGLGCINIEKLVEVIVNEKSNFEGEKQETN